MRRRDAIAETNKLTGGFGEVHRVPRKHRSFVFLVGRRGSDSRFYVMGTGRSYDEAVIQARIRVHKQRNQMEIPL